MTKTNRNLHSLVYSSLATPGFNSEEIESLLLNARCYNEQQDITGLLLFHEGAFLQVLEGDRRTISHLFEKKLMRDPRHSAVTLFHDEQINRRQFQYWHLAYNDLNDPAPQISAPYREFLNQHRSLYELKNNTQKALDLVRQIHRRILCRQSPLESSDGIEE